MLRRRLRDRSIGSTRWLRHVPQDARSMPLHRREQKKKRAKYGPKRREYGTPAIQRAIDPSRERSRRRSADSRADDRQAGGYSRHTFELQCKRTSVEPYTYSMLLYLKWWKWWQLNVVSVHFYKGRGCISKDKKKDEEDDTLDMRQTKIKGRHIRSKESW